MFHAAITIIDQVIQILKSIVDGSAATSLYDAVAMLSDSTVRKKTLEELPNDLLKKLKNLPAQVGFLIVDEVGYTALCCASHGSLIFVDLIAILTLNAPPGKEAIQLSREKILQLSTDEIKKLTDSILNNKDNTENFDQFKFIDLKIEGSIETMLNADSTYNDKGLTSLADQLDDKLDELDLDHILKKWHLEDSIEASIPEETPFLVKEPPVQTFFGSFISLFLSILKKVFGVNQASPIEKTEVKRKIELDPEKNSTDDKSQEISHRVETSESIQSNESLIMHNEDETLNNEKEIATENPGFWYNCIGWMTSNGKSLNQDKSEELKANQSLGLHNEDETVNHEKEVATENPGFWHSCISWISASGSSSNQNEHKKIKAKDSEESGDEAGSEGSKDRKSAH